tara:strand:+ start:93 stop:305 length:213 start_codon:yes stop_codon:yes gene_type:complete
MKKEIYNAIAKDVAKYLVVDTTLHQLIDDRIKFILRDPADLNKENVKNLAIERIALFLINEMSRSYKTWN